MSRYPHTIVPIDHVEPCGRRIRALLNGEWVFDTSNARYVWEEPHYPHYYIPLADVRQELLVDEQDVQQYPAGTARQYGLRVGERYHPGCIRVHTDRSVDGLADMVRFQWDALDTWFEEDEEIFLHPRDPYTRVDALRSTRRVRVEIDGEVLAESGSPVLVFETGVPTRYYLNRAEVDLGRLIPTETVTACPYKGRTSNYWSVRIGDTTHNDVAWAYDFPSHLMQPIAGMVAFFNEKADIFVNGEAVPRPNTRWSR
ncbi:MULTISPECIES: DUF427 domain-containing protein [unclassified Plantactinospora]|uniref:DUF427 domain-containing protein n=1 Tax=unclassified Plantactinospora TaxID=2631981 RepID=UPI000D17E666|nr:MULTISPECIES: DUF427 domain-containing protein [unclassified Plantactinospora]AVT31325.1 hypothetical protein C6361_19635 [Plantactinospora sp. BC1]AVT39858.1 hypothetical protein C6W10_29240 [Plantactinospora sp. BB1]